MSDEILKNTFCVQCLGKMNIIKIKIWLSVKKIIVGMKKLYFQKKTFLSRQISTHKNIKIFILICKGYRITQRFEIISCNYRAIRRILKYLYQRLEEASEKSIDMIGCWNVIVEIDASIFRKLKYNWGHKVNDMGYWRC